MKLWICRNCLSDPNENGFCAVGRKFEADKPVCPTCGADRSNPRHAPYIGECEVIHFDPPDPILKGRGTNRAACDTSIVIGSPQPHDGVGIKPYFGTAHRNVVNCRACMASEVFVSGAEVEKAIKAVDQK